jgi:hypothetical protein
MRAAFSGALGSEMKAKALTWAHETPDIKDLPDKVSRVKEAARKLHKRKKG